MTLHRRAFPLFFTLTLDVVHTSAAETALDPEHISGIIGSPPKMMPDGVVRVTWPRNDVLPTDDVAVLVPAGPADNCVVQEHETMPSVEKLQKSLLVGLGRIDRRRLARIAEVAPPWSFRRRPRLFYRPL